MAIKKLTQSAVLNAQQSLLVASPLFKRSSLALAVGVLSLVISGCGGSGNQDKGTPSSFKQNFSGVAVDGHISRATVFLDSNNNGTRDPWESFAYTDDDGYYGYNPNTGNDYCASDATSEDAQYCLETRSSLGNVTLRIDGGYDRLTGEPFLAQLSRRINARDPADTVNTVISPITTLVTATASKADQQTILQNLGLTEADLDIDYLNAQGNNEVNSWLLNTALKVHKTVTVLSDRIDDNYPEMLEETGMPNGASLAIYQSLARELSNSARVLDNVLTDPTQLTAILDASEDTIRAIYTRRGFDLPLDLGNSSNPDRFERVSKVAAEIPKVVDRLLNVMDVAMDQGQVIGMARALEALIIKATQLNLDDGALDNAFSFFLDDNNDSLIEELRLALSDDKADVNGLAAHSFNPSDFNSAERILEVARLHETTAPFSDLAGKKLLVSDMDLGFAPRDLKDIEIELNFLGDASAVNGGFTACAKYIEGASLSGLGEGNFHGEVVTGYWSLLGANADKPSSYSLLLTFEFLGATYQAIMKPAGETTIGGVTYTQIRFDNNGDYGIWHSKNGFTEQTTLPSSSADCKARLPSRIGL